MGTSSGINLKIGHYYLISDTYGHEKILIKVLFKQKYPHEYYIYKAQYKNKELWFTARIITYAKEVKDEEEIVFELI